jgi:D-lactate dehydrogenase
MYSIKMFGVREEEITIAQNWAAENNIKLSMTKEILTMDNLAEVSGFDGISLSQVGRLPDEIYPKLAQMGIKQLAQRSAGVDMYNLELAKENGIIITNVPSYSPESIAEFTVTTALELIRRTEEIRQRVASHDFSWEPVIRGRVLGNMTVAVIGTGRIGQITAKLFKGFGAKVVGYDLYPNKELTDILEYQDTLVDAVKQADVISLHMPAVKENYHAFDYTMFKNCKKDAILLNMARGSLVDTKALLQALDEGLLQGAGIDTYEYEAPYMPKDFSSKEITDELFLALINHPQVIYTPHIAYYTDEAVKNLVEGGLDATLEVLNTGDAKTRVN